jgi:hypothetical protein
MGVDASDDDCCYGSRTAHVNKPLRPGAAIPCSTAAAPEIYSADVIKPRRHEPDDVPQQELPAASPPKTRRQTCIISKAEERGISLPQVVRPLECVYQLLVRIADERCLRSDQTAQLSMAGNKIPRKPPSWTSTTNNCSFLPRL